MCGDISQEERGRPLGLLLNVSPDREVGLCRQRGVGQCGVGQRGPPGAGSRLSADLAPAASCSSHLPHVITRAGCPEEGASAPQSQAWAEGLAGAKS